MGTSRSSARKPRPSATPSTGRKIRGFDCIHALVVPLLDGEDFEHVTVLSDGAYTDMFVSETGTMQTDKHGPLPLNDNATAVYRNNWLTHNPVSRAEDLPAIHGPAVLFHRRGVVLNE